MEPDEHSIKVIHEPSAQARRVALVMFVALGLLVAASFFQAQRNEERIEEAEGRAAIAVEQNDRLQRSIDELIRLQAEADQAERERDIAQQALDRRRDERLTTLQRFIASLLANSSDPELRDAVRELEESGDLPPGTSNSSSPRGSQADPRPDQMAPPPRQPSPRPQPRPTPAPSPQPSRGPLGGTVDDVCALSNLC